MKTKRIVAGLLALCLLILALPELSPARAEMPYYIEVDITNQIVTVYENSNRTTSGIVRQMLCSSGKGNRTPRGWFTLPRKQYAKERTEWYYFPQWRCYAKWGTRIKGGILFHSILYSNRKIGPTKASRRALGSKASHGCVRLLVEDAKWIALNCQAGTVCRIFNSGRRNNTLRKRLKRASFSRDARTYDSYVNCAMPLRQDCMGSLVDRLQSRLKTLGFYNGPIDGWYTAEVAEAVRNFESAVGRGRTGVTTQDLWNRIFADNAPAGMYTTLSQGVSGPPVAVLQQMLKTLLFYDGSADGVYSASVKSAVANWQRCNGQSATGAATGAQQQAMARTAASLKAQFPEGKYELTSYQRDVLLAAAKAKIKMYKKASKRSGKLTTIKKNQTMRVQSRGGSWSLVQFGGKTGWVQTSRLRFYIGQETVYTYQAIQENLAESNDLQAAEEEAQEDAAENAEEETSPEAAEQPAVDPGEEATDETPADPAGKTAAEPTDPSGEQPEGDPEAGTEPEADMETGAVGLTLDEGPEQPLPQAEDAEETTLSTGSEIATEAPSKDDAAPGTEDKAEPAQWADTGAAGLTLDEDEAQSQLRDAPVDDTILDDAQIGEVSPEQQANEAASVQIELQEGKAA